MKRIKLESEITGKHFHDDLIPQILQQRRQTIRSTDEFLVFNFSRLNYCLRLCEENKKQIINFPYPKKSKIYSLSKDLKSEPFSILFCAPY